MAHDKHLLCHVDPNVRLKPVGYGQCGRLECALPAVTTQVVQVSFCILSQHMRLTCHQPTSWEMKLAETHRLPLAQPSEPSPAIMGGSEKPSSSSAPLSLSTNAPAAHTRH